MNIVAQLSLDDYLNKDISFFECAGQLEEFAKVLHAIPSASLIETLNSLRGDNGRDDYPNVVMWNLYVAQRYFEHETIASLCRELERNPHLRRVCGLNFCTGKHIVPPERVFTTFKNNMSKLKKQRKDIFQKLVEYMYENVNGFGEEVAADGKIIETYANKQFNESKEDVDGRTDTDAKYTKKEYHYIDKAGNEKVKSLTFLGYRVHIINCVMTELPIAYVVTPANDDEKKQLLKILKDMPEEQLKVINYLMADRGYDSKEVLGWLKDNNIKAIIDIRNMWKDGEKTKQYKNTDIVYNYKGEVFYVDEKGEEQKMNYKGYDSSRDALRYEYEGRVYRIKCEEDARVFTEVARDSKKHKRLYNKRTSVERLNGRIDRDYKMEKHAIRNLDKMELEVDMIMITMLAVAKVKLENGDKKIRSLLN